MPKKVFRTFDGYWQYLRIHAVDLIKSIRSILLKRCSLQAPEK